MVSHDPCKIFASIRSAPTPDSKHNVDMLAPRGCVSSGDVSAGPLCGGVSSGDVTASGGNFGNAENIEIDTPTKPKKTIKRGMLSHHLRLFLS